MSKTIFLLLFIWTGFIHVQAQSIKLPQECEIIIKNDFRSWKIADVSAEIKDYYARERKYEQPNLIKGDWNGDGKTDYAILLNKRDTAEEKIILVLMKIKERYKAYTLSGNDCIMSVKKGKKGYNYETGKYFRHKNDSIFNYIWEKAGETCVWEKGKFRVIATSD